jgi:hypothetical protein
MLISVRGNRMMMNTIKVFSVSLKELKQRYEMKFTIEQLRILWKHGTSVRFSVNAVRNSSAGIGFLKRSSAGWKENIQKRLY